MASRRATAALQRCAPARQPTSRYLQRHALPHIAAAPARAALGRHQGAGREFVPVFPPHRPQPVSRSWSALSRFRTEGPPVSRRRPEYKCQIAPPTMQRAVHLPCRSPSSCRRLVAGAPLGTSAVDPEPPFTFPYSWRLNWQKRTFTTTVQQGFLART